MSGEDEHLHAVGDALAVRQQLGQVLGSQHVSERGLGQQAGGEVCVRDVGHGGDGVTDAEVHHPVHADGHRVLGQDLRRQQQADTPRISGVALYTCLVALVMQ